MIKIAAGVYLLGVMFGGFLNQMYHKYKEPYCPTEDSCVVDYYEGKWHIREDQ